MRRRGGCLGFSMPDQEVVDGLGNGWVAVVYQR